MELLVENIADAGLNDAIAGTALSLPYAYLPSITRETLVRIEQHRMEELLSQDGTRAFCVDRQRVQDGLALLNPLPWDASHYGIKMGRIALCHTPRASLTGAVEELITSVLHFATEDKFDFIDLQVHASDLALIHSATRQGIALMATHLCLVWDLGMLPDFEVPAHVEVREADESEAAIVGDLAARSIPPYSRFVVDDQLPQEKAVEVFRAWAQNSVNGYADRVQVALVDGQPAGYCTWRFAKDLANHGGPRLADLNLTAVAPEFRRKHVMYALMGEGTHWLRKQGFELAQVCTHVLNTGMQRCAHSLGARSLSAHHTFHWHRETDFPHPYSSRMM